MGGAFIIQADEWKSFLVGHYLFMDSPSDQHAFQFDRKLIALDDKQRAFYVIRIGQGGDLLPVKFESQLKMDRLPPPESILSDFNNRNFGGTQGLLLRTCKLTCLLAAWRTAFVRPHRQNHWHHRIWAYLMLTQQPKL
jgi:hypothetical protein